MRGRAGGADGMRQGSARAFHASTCSRETVGRASAIPTASACAVPPPRARDGGARARRGVVARNGSVLRAGRRVLVLADAGLEAPAVLQSLDEDPLHAGRRRLLQAPGARRDRTRHGGRVDPTDRAEPGRVDRVRPAHRAGRSRGRASSCARAWTATATFSSDRHDRPPRLRPPPRRISLRCGSRTRTEWELRSSRRRRGRPTSRRLTPADPAERPRPTSPERRQPAAEPRSPRCRLSHATPRTRAARSTLAFVPLRGPRPQRQRVRLRSIAIPPRVAAFHSASRTWRSRSRSAAAFPTPSV